MAIRKITITDQRLPVGLYRFRVIEMSEETDPKTGGICVRSNLPPYQ